MVVQSRKRSVWRRVVGVALMAHVLSGMWFQVLMPNPCRGLTPSDWEYWAFSCWAMSGASEAPRNFVIR